MVHHKQQLIKFLEQNITDRVLQNALHRGAVEFLGGFSPLIGNKSGWIVKLTSYYRITYNIGIIENSNTGNLQWIRVTEIPWQNWDGDKTENKLYSGDNPEKYLELKNEKGN